MSKGVKDRFGYLGTEPTALREDLNDLLVALQALAKSEGAEAVKAASDAAHRIADRTDAIADDLTGRADAVVAAAARGRNHVEEAVRAQPLLALSLAAVTGFLVAMLVRR